MRKKSTASQKPTNMLLWENMEEKLKASEERFRLLSEAAEEGIAIHDNGVIVEANQALARMFGYELSEMIGMKTESISTPESFKIIREHIAAEYNKPYEGIGVRKDGSVFVCSLVGKPYKYKNRILRVAALSDITERKNAEKSLKESEERYRLLTDNVTDTIFTIDMNLNYTYASPSTYNLVGYTADELITLRVDQIFDPETLSWFAEMFAEELEIEKRTDRDLKRSRVLEYQHVHKNGTKVWVENKVTFLRDENDTAVGMLGIVRDVTTRKQAEESLKKSEENYRLLADHMKDQIWLMDLDLKVTYISPSVEKLTGYTLDDLKETPLNKLLTPSSFQTATDFFSVEMPKALAATSTYTLKRSLELEFLCKDGKTLWAESMFSFIRDENGKPVSLLGEGRDITERKQMEDALRKSEENFHRSLDDSPLGVRISTALGETIYANSAILDIYGYNRIEELKETPLKERYTPESYDEFQIRKKKRLQGELGPSEYEISIVRKDGEVRHLHVLRKEIFWNSQKQSQVIYQDITLRRQAEKKLNDTLENLRQSIKTTIQVLGTASEARDPYTAGHQKRVANLARAIATEMKLPHDKIEAIRMAGAIHDIGKISVPSEILCKPAMLTDLEFALIKNHSEYSYEIMKDVESPWPLADIIRQHHERINGSGYPQGLKNADILIESRVLAVADVVEAMMSYRPYRPALGIDIALSEIENNAGILYDSNVVDACLSLFREKDYHIT